MCKKAEKVKFETLSNCPYCNSAQIRLKFAARDNINNIEGEFYLSECKSCRFIFQNPRIKSEYIHLYYPDTTSYYHIEPNIKLGKKQAALLQYVYDYNHLGVDIIL